MDTRNIPLILKSADDAKRYARFVISTSEVDTQKDVMLSLGCDLSYYRNNPVVYIEHGRYDPIPIGKSADPDGKLDVELFNDRVEAGCYYTSDDRGLSAYNLTVKDKVLRGASIGARGIEHKNKSDGGKIHTKWSLREWSLTGRPINVSCWAKSYFTNNNPSARHILKSISGSVFMLPGRKLNTKLLTLTFDKSKFADEKAVQTWLSNFSYTAKSVDANGDLFKAVIEDGKSSETVEIEPGVKAEVCEEKSEPILDNPDELTAGARFCKSFLETLNNLIASQSKAILLVEDETIRDTYNDCAKSLQSIVHATHTVAKGKYSKSDWGDVPSDWGTKFPVGLIAKAASAIRELVVPNRVLFKQDKDRYIKLVNELENKSKAETSDSKQQAELTALAEQWYKLTGERVNVNA